MSRSILVSGGPGSGKTTFAGSGSGRKWWAETDAGSFLRAAFPDVSQFDLHKYYPPLATMLNFGHVALGSQGGVGTFNTRLIEGMTELTEQFRDDLLAALQSGDFSDYVYDTGSLLWQHVQAGFMQEVQDAKNSEEAKRLDSLHYTEPNRRMRGYIMAPRMMGANLVIVEHEKEIWVGDKASGTYGPDGFKEVSGLMDCCLRFAVVAKRPVATVSKAGAGGLELVGIQIEEPTLAKVNSLLDAAEAIRAAGFSVPDTFEAVTILGASLE